MFGRAAALVPGSNWAARIVSFPVVIPAKVYTRTYVLGKRITSQQIPPRGIALPPQSLYNTLAALPLGRLWIPYVPSPVPHPQLSCQAPGAPRVLRRAARTCAHLPVPDPTSPFPNCPLPDLQFPYPPQVIYFYTFQFFLLKTPSSGRNGLLPYLRDPSPAAPKKLPRQLAQVESRIWLPGG